MISRIGCLQRICLAAVLALSATAVFAVQHGFGNYQIHVDADEQLAAGDPDYQIVVENEELLLTRLTATYSGQLSKSFVADLNKDGAFEVIVTFSFDGGHQTGVHIYSWKEFRLEPHKIATLNDEQQSGYRGNDEFAVADGKLIRIFQLYEEVDGQWTATAEQRRLTYSLDDASWRAQ